MNQKNNSEGTLTRLIIAAGIIAAGILLLLRNENIINYDVYSMIMSWPSILLVMSLVMFSCRNLVVGVILLGLGGYFSPLTQHLISFDITGYIWPVLLVVAGLLLAFGPMRRKRKGPFDPNDLANQPAKDESGFLRINDRFSGSHRVVVDEYFEGGEINASFSGIYLDLTRTKLREGNTYLDVDMNLSGIELHVPADWKIDNSTNGNLSGMADKRETIEKPEEGKMLVVRGKMKMSGIEIKN